MHHNRKREQLSISLPPFRNPNAARVHISPDTTLNDYLDGFLDSGGAALVDVFRQGNIKAVFADTLVISLRLPATPEDITVSIQTFLDALIDADVLPERKPQPLPDEQTPAPSSNTGLPAEINGLSAWESGYARGQDDARDGYDQRR